MENRYSGIQTYLNGIDGYGCLFLCLLSIAEEYNQKPVDLIEAVRLARTKKYISGNFYVENFIGLLNDLTGKKWSRRVVKTLPDIIKTNEYTIVKLINPKGGNHFKRRGFDTLINSITTKANNVEGYYIFTVE